MSLRRANRLRKTAEYMAVRRDGKSWADAILILNARPNHYPASRIGFTVSKRLGNAVNRNRIRRRLKSVVAETDLKCGWDLVVVARQRAQDADFHALKRSLDRLLDRANLRRLDTRQGPN